MKFIDLFAGLGGFHLALADIGHECVFASELDASLIDLYEKNFGMRPVGDIRKVAIEDIPAHDILCAGFPCQPFSKAGSQQGLRDEERGGLVYSILRIVRHHKPRFVLLENVPNLSRHNGGQTWQLLEAELRNLGYDVDHHRLSPHHFGIPQIRDRVFIVGDREGLQGFEWPAKSTAPTSIRDVLDTRPKDAKPIPCNVATALDAWQEFISKFPSNEELPSFPIWAMEFGADYPFETTTPSALSTRELRKYRGANGTSLAGLPRDEIFAALPSYARVEQAQFPSWKITFIRQNRQLYNRHREWLDDWKQKLLELPPSLQKFEWNAKGEKRDISQYILQVRASGIRVKRPTTAPSLVAMTTTQVPIIAWEERYMTPRECARLQSMERLELPETPTRAFAALGNAVNVEVVKQVAISLLSPRNGTSPLQSRVTIRSVGEQITQVPLRLEGAYGSSSSGKHSESANRSAAQ